MKNIHILTNWFKSPNETAFLYPLLKFKSQLLNKGYSIKFFDQPSEKFTECDVIIISSKFYSNNWSENLVHKTLQEIYELKKNGAKLIYADISDSTGVVHFKMLDIVDLYIKNQLYKNKNNYLKSFYGYRIYTDFYNRNYNVKDKTPVYSEPITNIDNLKKLTIGWNSALGNYGILSFYCQKIIGNLGLKFHLPYPKKKLMPFNLKKNTFQARFYSNYSRNTVGHMRKKIIEKLSDLYIYNKKLNRFSYYNELKRSRLILSPFGLGEITLKDFETFITGGILLKPNMNHLETWPNLYKENKFVIFHNWDLSDLIEKIEYCLSNNKAMKKIALDAQENYFSYLNGPTSVKKFLKHFDSVIERLKL